MVEEAGFRVAAMNWLDARQTPRVDFGWLSKFEYEGQRVPLMDRQRGIRKPAGFDAALAIRTTFTPPGQTAAVHRRHRHRRSPAIQVPRQ